MFKMNIIKSVLLFFAMFFLSMSNFLIAQNTGTINGRITDEIGPIPFANVVLLGTTMGAASDINGFYTINNVPAGDYILKASAVGYKAISVDIIVKTGETTIQNFTLGADILNMQEIVVTGTISPISKLLSTVAVSTLTPRELEQSNPRSTTEILRYVPGFTRVESSGGEVNQNISIRGILGVEYVMFMEDGLPVFPTMHTFFMNADNLFRPDENIQTVEVVRGGNSALFGSNTPGAIINFINKTGGSKFGGVVKATGGTDGLARYDFDFNGPLGQDWRFNIGGFYRYDRGVRYPGFPGIRGGQLKANLTKLLDNGYIKTSLKLINDRNQFILPLPFQNPDDPDYVPGFSDYGAMNTEEANNIVVPTPSGDLNFPLEDGLRTDAYWITADINFNFEGDWTLRNIAQYMQNKQSWNGIFTGQPTNATEWVNSLGLPIGSTWDLVYTNHFDINGNRIPFDMNSNAGLAFLSPSQLVTVKKPMSAFQDQIQVQKVINKKHTLSLGIYFANYTQTNNWFFSDILMDVRDNPYLVDLIVHTPTGNTNYTQNGFRKYVSLYRNGTGSATIFSGVLGGSFEIIPKLHLDIGFRYEWNDFVQSAENQSNIDLDSDNNTPYDNEQWGNKSFRHFNRSIDDWALSGGLNYSLNNQISFYAQASRAYKMPALDEFLDANAQQQIDLLENRRVVMVEGGIKFASPRLAFILNGFWGELTNIVGQGFEIDPVTGDGKWVTRISPDNRSYGVEFEISGSPLPGLTLLGVGTYTKPESVPGTGAAVTAGGIPDFIGNLSATYNYQGFSVFVDWHYVGARDLIDADYDPITQSYTKYNKYWELGAYTYMNLGASFTFPGQALTLAADLLNVYQSKGIEEGNPRLPGVQTYYFVARPILPRRLMVSLRYQF